MWTLKGIKSCLDKPILVYLYLSFSLPRLSPKLYDISNFWHDITDNTP